MPVYSRISSVSRLVSGNRFKSRLFTCISSSHSLLAMCTLPVSKSLLSQRLVVHGHALLAEVLEHSDLEVRQPHEDLEPNLFEYSLPPAKYAVPTATAFVGSMDVLTGMPITSSTRLRT